MSDYPYKHLFVAAFIEAAFFTLGEDEAGDELAPDSRAAMESFAGDFYERNRDAIGDYSGGETQAGHDLWFTLNGHGVGYWENAGEPAADALDAAVKASGHSEGLYTGDDGLLHWWREGID